MATYNRAHFIEETLLSIQNQTHSNWECFIIDDGSTDNSKEIITPFLNNDNRFKYFKRPKEYQKGLPGSRNYGLDLSNGDFIIFFDDDDIIHPDNLKTALKVIIENDVDFCHYQKLAFFEKLPSIEVQETLLINKISTNNIFDIITNKIGLASCTVLWKKECFKEIRFIEHLQYAEEWECYSRIILEGNSGVAINNILYYNRKHENSNTGEFLLNNPIRTQSYIEALLLVIINLKDKNLLTDATLRYFVQISIKYKKYNLFNSILNKINLNLISQIKWNIVYYLLPYKLFIHHKINKIK